MKILIVDDTNLNLQQAKNIIFDNHIKCELKLCSSGIEALEILKSEAIDILLLDIIMPKYTGIDILGMLRANHQFKNLIIIMFTSLNDKHYLQKSFELGANDYITKPIEEIEFISRIKSAIHMKSNQNTIINALTLLEQQNDKLRKTTFELQKTQNQLIQKEKLSAIGSLAAGVAHEINNPLGYLSSNYETLYKYVHIYKALLRNYKKLYNYSQGLKEDHKELYDILELISAKEEDYDLNFITDDIDDLLNDSKEGINKVSKIVKSLLNFSRADSNEGFKLNDLNDILEEILLVLFNDYKDFVNIDKNVDYSDEILCNRSELGQVFFNIILNGIQAIKSQNRPEKGKIHIQIYKNDDFVNCEIFDDGPGIGINIINKIFDPFFTTKDVGSGTGLGLSICHDIIVNKHKGEIVVKSEFNFGSTFIIKLPILI